MAETTLNDLYVKAHSVALAMMHREREGNSLAVQGIAHEWINTRHEDFYPLVIELVKLAAGEAGRVDNYAAHCLECGQNSLKAYPPGEAPSHGYICVHCVENLGHERCRELLVANALGRVETTQETF